MSSSAHLPGPSHSALSPAGALKSATWARSKLCIPRHIASARSAMSPPSRTASRDPITSSPSSPCWARVSLWRGPGCSRSSWTCGWAVGQAGAHHGFYLTEASGATQLTATCLLQRRQVFRQNLVERVKEHHKVRAWVSGDRQAGSVPALSGQCS